MTTSRAAYGVAAAYADTAVWVHNSVARVSMPVGRSSSVAGSSFMHVRNTRAAPAAIPGPMSGTVTVVNTRAGGRPRLRATSSSRGGACAAAALTAATASGRNRAP
jgi:hypothetical protein